ncbi:hypothetical protein Ciccas_007810 [Cichlidogyrus casuarinus]|uniref:EGF-like domain-containing protein n=1 Tax=Cichlidogyrus casuarinus TaxID=1844966 RepID=A0ABD2Q1U6_9PLAT
MSRDDFCLQNPCQNGGQCFNTLQGYRCECESGYRGLLCTEKEETNCFCENGATCAFDDEGSQFCQCCKGFGGQFCEVNVDECRNAPCGDNGVCIDEIAGFRCHCERSYYGENCQFRSPTAVIVQDQECSLTGTDFESIWNPDSGKLTGEWENPSCPSSFLV